METKKPPHIFADVRYRLYFPTFGERLKFVYLELRDGQLKLVSRVADDTFCNPEWDSPSPAEWIFRICHEPPDILLIENALEAGHFLLAGKGGNLEIARFDPQIRERYTWLLRSPAEIKGRFIRSIWILNEATRRLLTGDFSANTAALSPLEKDQMIDGLFLKGHFDLWSIENQSSFKFFLDPCGFVARGNKQTHKFRLSEGPERLYESAGQLFVAVGVRNKIEMFFDQELAADFFPVGLAIKLNPGDDFDTDRIFGELDRLSHGLYEVLEDYQPGRSLEFLAPLERLRHHLASVEPGVPTFNWRIQDSGEGFRILLNHDCTDPQTAEYRYCLVVFQMLRDEGRGQFLLFDPEIVHKSEGDPPDPPVIPVLSENPPSSLK